MEFSRNPLQICLLRNYQLFIIKKKRILFLWIIRIPSIWTRTWWVAAISLIFVFIFPDFSAFFLATCFEGVCKVGVGFFLVPFVTFALRRGGRCRSEFSCRPVERLYFFFLFRTSASPIATVIIWWSVVCWTGYTLKIVIYFWI